MAMKRDVIPTGLFTRTKYGYDEWLNRHNPYDDEYDEQLEEHLEAMRQMDEEEDQRNYCDDHHLKYNEIQPYL
jgi:hypothetical protein